MDIVLVIKAIILGLIEGITEFLPVSSTGHLIIFGKFLHFENSGKHLFEIAIQTGAILALCILNRKKLFEVTTTFYKNKTSRNFIYKIIIAFLPSVFFGVIFYKFIKTILFSPIIVAISLIVGGIFILIIESNFKSPKYKEFNKINKKTALKIGLYQVLSMIPGVSRSGATIMGGMLLKLDRRTATEFSFFLSIPTIVGATLYDIYNNFNFITFDNLLIILIGFTFAFFSALIVIEWFIGFVSRSHFKNFGWYRIGLGALVLLLKFF